MVLKPCAEITVPYKNKCCTILAVAELKLGETRNVYKILTGKHERKRTFGMSRHRTSLKLILNNNE
jgi:hypothetical protein